MVIAEEEEEELKKKIRKLIKTLKSF